jgi:hypothetical protein
MPTDKGWSRRFDEPIPEDAGNFITKIPKTEHEAVEWQAAMQALILVATHGGPTMYARSAPCGH